MKLKYSLAVMLLLIPAAMAGCTYTGGNWVILPTESCLVSNAEISMQGNLTVLGNLTMDNVVLKFPLGTNGEYGINVTGKLIVRNSNLTGAGRWFFFVEDGAIFNMSGSYLSNAGWPASSGSLPEGIRFKADGVYFTNNTVIDTQLVFFYSLNSVITDNKILVTDGMIGAGALRLHSSDYAIVKNNFINITVRKGYGIYFKYTNHAKFINNTIYTYGDDVSAGFFGEFSQFDTFRNNSVYSDKFKAYWFRASTKNLDIDTSNTAGGKPFYYFEGAIGTIKNIKAGQVMLNYVENTTVTGVSVDVYDFSIFFSKNVTVKNVDVLRQSVYIYYSSDITARNFTSKSLGVEASENVSLSECTVEGTNENSVLLVGSLKNVSIIGCRIFSGTGTYPNVVEAKGKYGTIEGGRIQGQRDIRDKKDNA
ncbi:MAG: hypothetical protein GXO63_00325 [Candidatus Micrarchaeota archaeon]|nr:hypothetical protein [Candidatus Micrarchaeota archaeon]